MPTGVILAIVIVGLLLLMFGILAILIICIAGSLYDMLKYSDSEKRRSIKFVMAQGPVPKVMFQKLTSKMKRKF